MNNYSFPQARVLFKNPKGTLFIGAPFDRILVSAAEEEFPKHFLDQLKVNGILVIPILEEVVKITKVDKDQLSILR